MNDLLEGEMSDSRGEGEGRREQNRPPRAPSQPRGRAHPERDRRAGQDRGRLQIADDFDAPLPEELRAGVDPIPAALVKGTSCATWAAGSARRPAISEMDAYEFGSQNARAPIIQIVDPNYTVLVKIAKSRLPFPSPQ
jgi:hypothetical protein